MTPFYLEHSIKDEFVTYVVGLESSDSLIKKKLDMHEKLKTSLDLLTLF